MVCLCKQHTKVYLLLLVTAVFFKLVTYFYVYNRRRYKKWCASPTTKKWNFRGLLLACYLNLSSYIAVCIGIIYISQYGNEKNHLQYLFLQVCHTYQLLQKHTLLIRNTRKHALKHLTSSF